MEKDEFLNIVAEQIRCKRARGPICEELLSHIECQTEAFVAEGLAEEVAMEKAVLEMGDPVEIGVAMDRIHRPKASVGMLILTGAIGVFSILLYSILGRYHMDSSLGNFYAERQILYIVAGYAVMLLVYHLDYSIFAGKAKWIAGGLLVFTVLGTIFRGVSVHGVCQNIRIVGDLQISVWAIMFLYVPVFGSLLYDYRGMGYGALWRLFLWAILPVLFFWRVIASSATLLLAGSLAVLFSIAVLKGWYTIAAKKVLAVFWGLFLGLPIAFIGKILLSEDAMDMGYRALRLKEWLNPTDENYHYVTIRAQYILHNSSFFGRNVDNLDMAVNEFPGFQDDYVLVTLVAAYGMVAGVLAVGLLLFLTAKIFHISFGQRNQLGLIIGCGCGVVFLTQILLSVMVSLNWCPSTSNTLPFFCYGGSSVLLYYALLGLVLSVYRYKEIPMPIRKVKNA